MIKIEKDLAKIPPSLKGSTTQKHRQKSIDANKYVKTDRFKEQDIKDSLKVIYNNKCAYCEQDIGDNNQHVEHYRPKHLYPWLALSWDNLFLCCDRCNTYKSDHFETTGPRISSFDPNAIKEIHALCDTYNKIEKPKMVNPEKEDVEALLKFDRAGVISSDDERVQYTIDTCHINREQANTRRKRLIDSLRNKIYDRILSERIDEIPGLLDDFKNETKEDICEYKAFRNYVIRNEFRSVITT